MNVIFLNFLKAILYFAIGKIKRYSTCNCSGFELPIERGS